IDDVHKAILEVFNIDKILTPEEDAARGLVVLLTTGSPVRFDSFTSIDMASISSPPKFIVS
ncbi:TrkA family potassium uptake protein, partial [Bacteroides sp. 519]|nr:TrkA family potassium uptake protein [Bacteroides sp. 519]